MRNFLIFLTILSSSALAQTNVNGSRSIKGFFDAASATSTSPIKSGTTLPAACNAGIDFFNKTNESDGLNLYICKVGNVWRRVGYYLNAVQPASCTIGDVWFDADETPGSNWKGCTTSGTPGTWTTLGGGGGESGYDTVRNHATGTNLAPRAILNCRDGVACNDDSANARTNIESDLTDRSILTLRDDFCGGVVASGSIGEIGWVAANNGGAQTANNSGANGDHPCVLRVYSGAGAGNDAMLTLSNTTSATVGWTSLTSTTWTAAWVFRMTAGVSNGNMTFLAGFGTERLINNAGGRDAINLRYDTTQSDTTYKVVSYSDTTLAGSCDTGIAPNLTDWITFRLMGSGSSTITAGWRVNGGAESTCTLPLANPNGGMLPGLRLATTNTTAKELVWDFWAMKMRGLTR